MNTIHIIGLGAGDLDQLPLGVYKKLKAAELKLKVYDKLIEVTNRELDADIVKKIEARLSENWQQKKD